MPITELQPQTETISNYIAEGRQFVLHDSSFVYEVTDIQYNAAENKVVCELQKLAGLKTSYSRSQTQKNYHYKNARADSIVQNEIHLHTSDPFTKGYDTQVTLPVSSIYLLEELVPDKRKMTNRNIGLGLATVGAVASIAYTIFVISEFPNFGEN